MLALYFSTVLALGSVMAFMAGAAAIIASPEKFSSRLWFIFNTVLFIWGMAYTIQIYVDMHDIAWWSGRVLNIAAVFIPALLLHFTAVFLNRMESWRYMVWLVYGWGAVLVPLHFSSLLIKDVFLYQGFYQNDPGPLYFLFSFYFLIATILVISLTAREFYRQPHRTRQQLKYILLAEFFGFFGGGWTFLFVYKVQVPVYPVIFFLAFPPLVGYAILRHQLFGFRFVANKIFVWMGLAFFIYCSYYVVSYVYVRVFGEIFNTQTYLVGIIIAPVFAIVFANPITKYLQGLADRILYKGHNPHRNFKDILSDFKDSTTLEQLHEDVKNYFKKILGVTFLDTVFFLDEKDVTFNSLEKRQYPTSSLQRLRVIASVYQKVIVKDDVLLSGKNHTDRGLFTMLNASVALPFFEKGSGVPVGFILASRASAATSYYQEDVALLESIRQGLNATFLRLRSGYMKYHLPK